MVAQAYPAKAMSEDFPPPLLLEGKVPPYFYFYKPDNKVVTKADFFLIAMPDIRRKEVVEDNLKRHKMGAWWRMRLYLNKEKAPYGQIPWDQSFSRIYDEIHEDDENEDETTGTWSPQEGKVMQAPQSSVAQEPAQEESKEKLTYQKGLPMIQAMGLKGTGGLGKNEQDPVPTIENRPKDRRVR